MMIHMLVYSITPGFNGSLLGGACDTSTWKLDSVVGIFLVAQDLS